LFVTLNMTVPALTVRAEGVIDYCWTETATCSGPVDVDPVVGGF
jgi:hypothetical protein